ncbi:MAG TPA: hypothetical protein VGO11_14570 [Chthoniobacteraceae bacterium]|jgi:hypothetical protein|nr:hypothetical protein [Chthoniobacteraceae bacterium]
MPPLLLRTLALSLLLLLPAAAQTPPAVSEVKGKRVFTCAHSFHVFVYRMLDEAAKNAGITGHENVGLSSIGGSQVIQHWNAAEEKNAARKALTEGKVDVLTLAPIWMPDKGIDNFAKLGFEHNPNIVVTVQEFWLPNDTYEPRYPLETRKQVDHNATDLAELRKNQAAYDHDVDEYCAGINKELGHPVIVTVPIGQATLALREKIAAGQVPGITKQWDLFRDMWGHPQIPVQILDAYCHYAVIYKRSPVGLPMPSEFVKANKPEWDEKLNRLLQELAWDAVTHHPMSGVTAGK